MMHFLWLIVVNVIVTKSERWSGAKGDRLHICTVVYNCRNAHKTFSQICQIFLNCPQPKYVCISAQSNISTTRVQMTVKEPSQVLELEVTLEVTLTDVA